MEPFVNETTGTDGSLSLGVPAETQVVGQQQTSVSIEAGSVALEPSPQKATFASSCFVFVSADLAGA